MKRIEIPSWVERLLGMGPVAPPPHVFGLDREGLRYARLVARGGDRLTLAEHHLAPLPPGLVSDVSGMGGALADAAALAAAVRQLRERASAPFADASLVVPDDWLHLTFVEVGELPRQAEARLEVLRWKLRKSLPFRIEDLRLVAREVAPRPGQAEPRRLMVGYGLEALLAGLEEAFAGEGVRLGCITHRSGALLAAAAAATDQAPLAALLAAGGRGYTLLVVRGGEPVGS